jgi:hypothetical protein
MESPGIIDAVNGLYGAGLVNRTSEGCDSCAYSVL